LNISLLLALVSFLGYSLSLAQSRLNGSWIREELEEVRGTLVGDDRRTENLKRLVKTWDYCRCLIDRKQPMGCYEIFSNTGYAKSQPLEEVTNSHASGGPG